MSRPLRRRNAKGDGGKKTLSEQRDDNESLPKREREREKNGEHKEAARERER